MPGQRKYAFFALIAASVFFMAYYIHRHRQGQTGKFDNFLISSAGAIQTHGFYLSHGTRTLTDRYLFLVNASKKKDELEAEVARLRNRVVTLEDVQVENGRLREALEFRAKVPNKLIPAHIVAHDVSTDYVGIRVDRGSDSGITKGMGVISPAGVVGRVQRVTPKYSDVVTIIDPTSKIDGVIQRSRARGIVYGQSRDLSCKMKYVDRLEDITVNDSVISSGFGDIFS